MKLREVVSKFGNIFSKPVYNKLLDDPVYNKLLNLKPEEFFEESGRGLMLQVKSGIREYLNNFHWITRDPAKYEKYSKAEETELVKLILGDEKYLHPGSYRFLKEA